MFTFLSSRMWDRRYRLDVAADRMSRFEMVRAPIDDALIYASCCAGEERGSSVRMTRCAAEIAPQPVSL